MAEGKKNLAMPRKRMQADFVRQISHLSHQQWEFFKNHNSRRESKAELSPSVLYEKKKLHP